MPTFDYTHSLKFGVECVCCNRDAGGHVVRVVHRTRMLDAEVTAPTCRACAGHAFWNDTGELAWMLGGFGLGLAILHYTGVCADQGDFGAVMASAATPVVGMVLLTLAALLGLRRGLRRGALRRAGHFPGFRLHSSLTCQRIDSPNHRLIDDLRARNQLVSVPSLSDRMPRARVVNAPASGPGTK